MNCFRLTMGAVACAAALNACALDDSVITGVPMESDALFDYHIEGDMAVPEPRFDQVFLASGGTGPGVLYLNFDGATIEQDGWQQNNAQMNSSFIVGGTSVLPAFDGSHWPGSRQSLIDAIALGVREDFADFGVEVTTTRPTAGSYTMIVVGGHSSDVGMPNGVLGVAPLDGSNWNPNDVGFVFSDSAGEFGYLPRYVAHVISHEIGHTVGLEHIERTADIMQPAACHCAQSWGAGTLSSDATMTQDDREKLAIAFPPGASPLGHLGAIGEGGRVRGWACDPDLPDQSIDVDISLGGVAGSGTEVVRVPANVASGATVEAACGGGTAHRFDITLPQIACGEEIHVYGVNAEGTPGSTIEITNSPKSAPVCASTPASDPTTDPVVPEPANCGASNRWIEDGTHADGEACGNTCSGYHWSWCDFNGDGNTSDGWQYCLASGWAVCAYHPH